MTNHDAYGLSGITNEAGHVLLIALVVISAICIGLTVYSLLTTARGRSHPW
jgi:hypothetical protein